MVGWRASLEQVGHEKDAHDEPDIDGGDRLDSLPGRKGVDDDHDDRREHDADEEHVRIGELILADDRRRPDAEAGNDEHEDGPDQDKKHGELPLSNLVGKAVERGNNGSESGSPATSRPKS